MSTLTGTIRDKIDLTNAGVSELGSISDDVMSPANYPKWTVASGTGDSQANLLFRDQRTLALSTSENLDLTGVLIDSYGTTLTFVDVKMLYVFAAATNGGNIIVGGAASAAFLGPFADATDKMKLPAGAWLKWVAPIDGYAVTATTADILKIENDDGAAAGVYDIVIVGTNA